MKKLLAFVICLTFLTPCSYAKKDRKVSEQSEHKAVKATSQDLVSNEWLDIEIIAPERERIKEYYRLHHGDLIKGKEGKKKKKLPPGLEKKLSRGGELPPGWQKKVAKGEILDAELYRRATPLPNDLIIKLPPQPKGTVLIKVEGKIIRLIEATRTILDVFDIY
jgi:hypothetical protein